MGWQENMWQSLYTTESDQLNQTLSSYIVLSSCHPRHCTIHWYKQFTVQACAEYGHVQAELQETATQPCNGMKLSFSPGARPVNRAHEHPHNHYPRQCDSNAHKHRRFWAAKCAPRTRPLRSPYLHMPTPTQGTCCHKKLCPKAAAAAASAVRTRHCDSHGSNTVTQTPIWMP
jgi:hypothetical protein